MATTVPWACPRPLKQRPEIYPPTQKTPALAGEECVFCFGEMSLLRRTDLASAKKLARFVRMDSAKPCGEEARRAKAGFQDTAGLPGGSMPDDKFHADGGGCLHRALLRVFCIVFLLGILTGCGQKPGVVWEPYAPERMAAARQAGQPVILYFYASWCGPCHMMEQWTFRDERVIRALEPFVRLKADMSQKYSPQVRAVSREYQVRALPTVLFFNDKGVRLHMHHVGFVRPEKLLKIYSRR